MAAMAANLIRCRFASFFIQRGFKMQPNSIQALNLLPWCHPCLVQQNSSLHTSDLCCGGRPKSEWRRKRVPALTKLCSDKSEKLKTRKAFGGGRKTKVTRTNHGLYTWKSKDVQFETPIFDVLYNTAHKDFTEKKIMVKGTIVKVDGQQFKLWYDKEFESQDIEVCVDAQDLSGSSDKVLQQLENGKVLAKVSSRPGQEGKVDGYLLEGNELDEYLDQTKGICTPDTNS